MLLIFEALSSQEGKLSESSRRSSQEEYFTKPAVVMFHVSTRDMLSVDCVVVYVDEVKTSANHTSNFVSGGIMLDASDTRSCTKTG